MRMWQLSNFTPFPVIAGFERDAQGHSHYLVTISASFRIDAAGRAWFDADQPPPLQSPLFLGIDPEGLMIADADQGLPHPGIDILLAADALLAPAEPRRRLSLRLAGMQRDLDLLAPMQRDRRGHARLLDPGPAPAPVPLDWRSSWGGAGVAENPLGTGAAGTEGEALPRLTATDAALMPGQPVPPALNPVSFSPLPRAWPQRARLAGTFDTGWQRRKAPLLPDDYDPRFGHAAQPAQVHPGPLPDGAEVELTGMQTPAGDAPWRFRLPAPAFRLAIFHMGGWTRRDAVLQRIVIDARTGRLRMVWRGGFTLARIADDVRLRETQIHLDRAQGYAVLAPDAAAYHRFAPDPTQSPQPQEMPV